MNNCDIHITEDKKRVYWVHKGKDISIDYKYPIEEIEVLDHGKIYVLVSYKEVKNSENVFEYNYSGKHIGNIPLPFDDLYIRSFTGIDVNSDGHLTLYLDTLGDTYHWETRIKYDPIKKSFYDRKKCK